MRCSARPPPDSTRPSPSSGWSLGSRREQQEFVRLGESTYYSGLYVDADNRLQAVNSELGPHNMEPLCPCCTHTFNGIRFTRKYRPN